MMLKRAVFSSRKAYVLAACAIAFVAWQAWLTVNAPRKLSSQLSTDRPKLDVLVTLAFPPERFHIEIFQRHGRVTGTDGNSVEVRGVKREDLAQLARPHWVRHVDPRPKGD